MIFPEHAFKNPFLGILSAWDGKIQNGFISLMFGSQMIVGIAYYTTDLSMPCSASKEAAKFMRDQKLDALPIVGNPDWAAEDFAALLYYLERQEFGSFVVGNGKRMNVNANLGRITEAMDIVLGKDLQQALLIVNHPITTSNGKAMLEHGMLKPTIKLDMLNRFDKAMVPDEVYYI